MPSHSGNPTGARVSILTRTMRWNAALLGLTMSLVAASGLQAQKISVSIHDDAADSVAFIVPRLEYDVANAKVRSRDKTVSLLLTDTTLVLQLSERGMDRLETDVSETRRSDGLAARMVARMLGAGITELLDHGIAFRLSALRSARADGNRLVLEDRSGHRVFENVEVNGTHLLEDLPSDDARRFAADVNRAIWRLR